MYLAMYVIGVLTLPVLDVDAALCKGGTTSVGGVANMDGAVGLYGMTFVLASSVCITYYQISKREYVAHR